MENLVVKHRSGESYKIILPHGNVSEQSLTPESFWNESSAQQFINNLVVSQGIWRDIINQCGSFSTSCESHDNIEKQVSSLMMNKKIKFYPIKIMDTVEHPPEKRVLKSDNTIYRFEPSSSLLFMNSAQTQSFKNIDDAYTFLNKISNNEAELAAIAKELNIDIPKTAYSNEGGITDIISEELISGNTVIIVDKSSSTPPKDKEEENKSNIGLKKHTLADKKEEFYTEIEFLYDNDESTGIAIPYIVTLSDGSKKTGKLGDRGCEYFPDIPAGNVKVEFGYPEAEQELIEARKALKGYFEEIIDEVKVRAKLLDKELNKLNVLEQGAVLTGAIFVGLYDEAVLVVDAAKIIVESGIDIIVEIDEARNKALKIILSGDIDGAKKELEELVSYGEEQYNDMQETYDTLQLVYSDPELKSMLTGFPEDYIKAMPTVEQTGMASGIALNIVFTLVTGGAGGAVSIASKAPKFIKAADKIQEILVLLKKTKLTKKQSKSHNTKLTEKTKKPKKEDLKEKDKKKHKCKWKNCRTTHDKVVRYKNKGNIVRGKYTGSWIKPWIKNGPGEKGINPVVLSIYKEEAEKKHASDAAKTVKEVENNNSIITYATNNHHLIPVKAMEKVEKILGHNSKLINWDLNHSNNGVVIPYFKTDIFRHDIQCHKTSHPKYNRNVTLLLKDLEKESKKFCYTNSQKTLSKKLNKISNQLRIRVLMWDKSWLLRTDALDNRMKSFNRAGITEPTLPSQNDINTALKSV